MKLYHGFGNLEQNETLDNILYTDKLICNFLPKIKNLLTNTYTSTHKINPGKFYINPSLLKIAGTDCILPYSYFDLSRLAELFADSASKTAKREFNADITPDEIINHIGPFANKEDSREFYRRYGVFLSQTPIYNYVNFIAFDVPEHLVQNSPQNAPIVAGELSLKYATHLLIEQKYKKEVKKTLEKYNSTLPIEIYNKNVLK